MAMMKGKLLLLVLCVQLASIPAKALALDLLSKDEPKQIVVDNRVLAKVNDKVISVMDVMKKMDVIFFREFPQYSPLPEARFQFYQINWQSVLQELINKELIMAEAAELKIEVSNGDVRQEMEDLFGPHIIVNLDKIGITYEEATKMIRSDLILKRMLGARAQIKAIKKVTPQIIFQAYQAYAASNKNPDQWTYQTISVRDKDPAMGSKVTQQIYNLLTDKRIPLEKLTEYTSSQQLLPASTQLTISNEISHTETEISASNKEILSQLKSGTYSLPHIQKSRSDSSQVSRIFFLKQFKPGGAAPFNEVANEIKEALIDQEAEKETEIYFKKLHKHFDIKENPIEEMLAEGFVPFKLS
jgi:SurA N-terminal domain